MNAPANATQTLEPRPLYGIGTVARLTDLKSDTLRVWERRYGLGASYKSATGRRQYTQSDLDHLQLVSALVKQGVRIGEIAGSDRKTLEVLLEQQGRMATSRPVPPAKPRVVFVGADLCQCLLQNVLEPYGKTRYIVWRDSRASFSGISASIQ